MSRDFRPALRLEELETRWVPAITGAFLETPLVSNQTGVAPLTDASLVNGWGIAVGPSTGFWVSANGSDLSEIYTGDVAGSAIQKAGLEVTIPGGAPTGQVFNSTSDFVVNSAPAAFIFASESGNVTAWNSGTAAITEFSTSNGAVYKGIALANNGTANFLYLADFHNNHIDVLDSTFKMATLSGNFTDPNLPSGFAPFNIAAIGGKLYVSYAKQDAAAHDDVAGAGNGFIDVFDPNGNFLNRLVTQGALNSPWGMVQAPSGYSSLGGDLLVGNFGDGKINVYDPTNGAFVGTLLDSSRNPIAVDGLWGLAFGNGSKAGDTNTLYFAAGPNSEANGLFGKITAPARGGDGPGGNIVSVSGQANGSAQLFTLNANGSVTSKGAPVTAFAGFTGDVRTAVGDVDGDGIADIALVTGPGAPTRFAVINGKDNSVMVAPMAPFAGSESFSDGATVAVGDIDGDGKAEIVITPDLGGGPRVTIFSVTGSTATVKANFFGIDDPNFRGGVRASLGDVNGDGIEDLGVSAGFGGGPRIALFNGTTLLSGTPTRLVNDFFAFPGTDPASLRNGAYVAVGDFNGDGHADLAFTSGVTGAPRVFVVSGSLLLQNLTQALNSPLADFFAFDSSLRSGARVAVKEANGDGDRELLVSSGPGQAPSVVVYLGATLHGGSPPGTAFTPFTGSIGVDGVWVG